ncbi:TPM domain-containing protein [Bacteroides graminisolvens]|jgi:uncharacterized protein|uniref:TPM domain-containing protein n=1 Tax=Bacteroides graminisolvens TaxID=477666 RepID=UPI000AE8CBF3|nr:TPM domain-containing protein [Bacteroides graminisolvens]
MKRLLIILTFFCLWLQVQSQENKIYTVDNIPKVHLQNKTRYVCNPEGILSEAAVDSIDRMLYHLEEQTGIESVVAVLPSIGEVDCFDFSHQLLNSWGVGKKGKDNGLVILLVTDQRCIQFYTGYGLEGVLPDAICKRIQTKDMIPYLKDQDWDKGMVSGIKSTVSRLDGSMPNDAQEESEDGGIFFLFIAIAGVVLVGGLTSLWAIWISTKCPKCGKHKLQRSSTQLISKRNGVKTEDVIYTCMNCGHSIVRRQQSYDDNYRGGGGSGGPFIGGFGGGSFGGGGGFSGGSFGGGSGGGGGAGSRF